ncbi:MAG: TIGR03086 family metal-binding protein [Acidimicrobiales bacterium]
MPGLDLGPAATRMVDLIQRVPDDQLDAPTPCASTSLGDLIDHVVGLTLAFTAAATKAGGDMADRAPSADASRLGADWRDRISGDLPKLAQAWRDPAAWEGMTRAGGLDLPGEVAGVVALDELVLHGWDVARASGQPYECDQAALEACHSFVEQFSGPGMEEQRKGLYGPVVLVADDAPLLDRVLGLSGRDPQWSPS